MSRRRENVQRTIYAGVLGAVSRFVDGAVGLIAPETANRMRASRLLAASGFYEGAKRGGHSQNDKSGSADAETIPDLQKLRDNSRAMIRNDAHAAAAAGVIEDNVVGDGIRPQSQCTPEATGLDHDACETWRRDCEAVWREWADEADATDRGDFYDLQKLVARSMMGDGESIGHAVQAPGGVLKVELIDPDRLESPNFADTDTIRGGVELGPLGQPVAYHILKRHPADLALGGASGSLASTKIPAAENGYSVVQHIYRRQRPGQTRGVPWLACALPYNNHLHHYLNSELIAARVNSSVAMFVKRSGGALGDAGDSTLKTSNGEFVRTITPGAIEHLADGEEIQPFTPNRPGNQFDPFVRRILRAIWSSQGLSYEVVAKDFGGMNYSSARSMLLECRRWFDGVRKLLIRSFCNPWWSNVIRAAIASGKLQAPRGFLDNPKAFLAVRWVSPAYGWVDPEVEVESSRMAIEANLSTHYDEAARVGMDAEELVVQRARFEAFIDQTEKKFGLEPGRLRTKGGPASAAAAPAAVPSAAGEPPTPPPAPAPDDQVDDQENTP